MTVFSSYKFSLFSFSDFLKSFIKRRQSSHMVHLASSTPTFNLFSSSVLTKHHILSTVSKKLAFESLTLIKTPDKQSQGSEANQSKLNYVTFSENHFVKDEAGDASCFWQTQNCSLLDNKRLDWNIYQYSTIAIIMSKYWRTVGREYLIHLVAQKIPIIIE